MAQSRHSTLNGSQTNIPGTSPEKTYFEQQRELLISEIAQSLEHVLQNINSLNRSLEEVIQVGNEFAPVESLWSLFENVMAKENQNNAGEEGSGQAQGKGHEEEGRTEVDTDGEMVGDGEGETEMEAK